MESFEQRMRVESDCYEDGRNGTVLFVHFEDALKIAREADAALAAQQHIIATQRRVYDETVARMTALNTAKDELLAFYEDYWTPSERPYDEAHHAALRTRIRSLENGR